MVIAASSLDPATAADGIGPTMKMEHTVAIQTTRDVERRVKMESESPMTSPEAHSEDDKYEEAGDLDFTDSGQGIFLTRLPKWLWKSWSAIDTDQEICLGTIRVEGDVQSPKRISLLLSSDVVGNNDLPKEYNMQVSNLTPGNTFIFTEKDLPGYNDKRKSLSRRSPATFYDRGKPHPSGLEKNKKRQLSYKKLIPKKTAIAGQVQKEINCLAVENHEYKQLMEKRTLQALRERPETQLLKGPAAAHAGSLLVPGTIGTSTGFKAFIKTTTGRTSRAQELKAARIPENELLDQIHNCFKRYKYWSLKSLKAELKQPEAYLRQTLELVAHLVRQGPHAMTWQLKNRDAYDVQDRTAPDPGVGLDGVSDSGEGMGSDEDDVQLEDVISQQ